MIRALLIASVGLLMTSPVLAQSFSPNMQQKPIPCYSEDVFERTASANGYFMVNMANVAENNQVQVNIASFLNVRTNQMLFVEQHIIKADQEKNRVCVLGEGSNLTFPPGANES